MVGKGSYSRANSYTPTQVSCQASLMTSKKPVGTSKILILTFSLFKSDGVAVLHKHSCHRCAVAFLAIFHGNWIRFLLLKRTYDHSDVEYSLTIMA